MANSRKAKATSFKHVIMPNGDLVACIGCRLECIDDGYGMYDLLLDTPTKPIVLVGDQWWAGKDEPTKEISNVRDTIVKGLLNSRIKVIDLRSNRTLARLLKEER